jgi:hypothetical protein
MELSKTRTESIRARALEFCKGSADVVLATPSFRDNPMHANDGIMQTAQLITCSISVRNSQSHRMGMRP